MLWGKETMVVLTSAADNQKTERGGSSTISSGIIVRSASGVLVCSCRGASADEPVGDRGRARGGANDASRFQQSEQRTVSTKRVAKTERVSLLPRFLFAPSGRVKAAAQLGSAGWLYTS